MSNPTNIEKTLDTLIELEKLEKEKIIKIANDAKKGKKSEDIKKDIKEENRYDYVANYYQDINVRKKLVDAMIKYFIDNYKICKYFEDRIKIKINLHKKEEIYIMPSNFKENIKKCLDKVIVIYLSYSINKNEYEGSSHANIIFIRPKQEVIYIIDPLGEYRYTNDLINIIKEMFEKTIMKDYKVIHSKDLDTLGPQKFGKIQGKFNGYCVVYSLYIVNEWLINSKLTLKEVYEKITSYKPLDIYNKMLDYLKYILKKTNTFCLDNKETFDDIIRDKYVKLNRPLTIYGFYKKDRDRDLSIRIFFIKEKRKEYSDWLFKVNNYTFSYIGERIKDRRIEVNIRSGDISVNKTIPYESNKTSIIINTNFVKYNNIEYDYKLGFFTSITINPKRIENVIKFTYKK